MSNFTKELTPIELAEVFWNFNSMEQAIFFNHLGRIVNGGTFDAQMAFMAGEPILKEEGKQVMRTIGVYSDLT